MNFRRAQTAVEYIVLISIVIVVALVVVQVMGGFPGIGAGSAKKISDYKLSRDVVGVEDYYIGASSSTFVFKNNYHEPIILNEFRLNRQLSLTCNSSYTNPQLPLSLNVGEVKSIVCNSTTQTTYPLSDNSPLVIGILYTDEMGAVRLAGNVESYDGTISEPIINLTEVALAEGLIAYYPFNGNFSDMSGNELNGNCSGTNCPTLTSSGIFGSAYRFDGANDSVRVLDQDVLSFGTGVADKPFSISSYFKTNGQNSTRGIVGKYASFGYEYYTYVDSANRFGVVLRDASAAVNVSAWATINLTNNTWYQAVVTYDGRGGSTAANGINIYINGFNYSGNFLNNANYVAMENGNSSLTIGSIDGNISFFNGTIDDVRIYGRVLSSSEVLDFSNLIPVSTDMVLAMDFNLPPSDYNGSLVYVKDNSAYDNWGVLN